MGKCRTVCHIKQDVSQHPVTTLLLVVILAAVVLTSAVVISGKSYTLNTYVNPATENQPSNLDLRFGFPLIQGTYTDPHGIVVTMQIVNDPIYPAPVFRIRYNATFYVDVLSFFFTTEDIRLNRGMPTQQIVYQNAEPALCDFMEANEFITAVTPGTYILISTNVLGGNTEFYTIIGAVRTHFNLPVPVGWQDMNLVLYPINIYPNTDTNYVVGQALVNWLFTFV